MAISSRFFCSAIPVPLTTSFEKPTRKPTEAPSSEDMGDYPLGNKFFSDLVHYTRSADFVIALLRDAQDANEYPFALGALAHYAADNEGHPIGVNRDVPLIYPKLARKFGPEVTYEDDPGAHPKTEFAFDVVEVAR